LHYLLGSDCVADGVGDDSEDLMSKFRGTKGKWIYSPALGEIKSDQAGLIADLVINGDEDDNGRLMAAAPELLESLQEAMKFSMSEEAYNKCAAAMSKALGQ
jgi:hypothetical protein